MDKKYTKHFDEWNSQKQELDKHITRESLYIKDREVWWVSVGVNIGTEIDGKNKLFERPVLIFRKIGREQFYGLPLTSKEKSGSFYRLINYSGNFGNVCLSQLRVFSTKRLVRKIGVVREDDFFDLKNSFIHFFSGKRF